MLIPKIAVAALIVLAGFWLSQYLGRATVVWAVNENIPSTRRVSTAVRIVIMLLAVVVAANHLESAGSLFLAAFIILVGERTDCKRRCRYRTE